MKSFINYGCIIFFYLVIIHLAKAQNGYLVMDTVHSISLEGNLLGDSPDRSVVIYLPPDYNSALGKRYPVVYFLHGNQSHSTIWTSGIYQGMKINHTMDSLINAGIVGEMILVMPDGYNRYRGSHFVNSTVSGNWADFITVDLVKYIDRKYRTIPSGESRGIAGHSMGGRASMYLGMNHPDVFCAFYGLSSGKMNFEKTLSPPQNQEIWMKLLQLEDFKQVNDFGVIRMLGLSAAFSPNPDKPPFFVDLYYEFIDGKIQPIQDVWERWHAFDPVALVPILKGNLNQLKAIRFDCGLSDFILSDSRAFAMALDEQGISYIYEEYKGNHVNRIRGRIERKVLPFFSEVLEFNRPSN
jgi:enterochelin esterase-like enzyme